MFLYVTEKIKNYHKIGISTDIQSRVQQYRTLIPDLKFKIVVQVPSMHNLRLYENTIKKKLKKYSLADSECYDLQLKYIQDFILRGSLMLNFIFLDFHLFLNEEYPKYGQFGNKARGVGYPYHKGVTVFLNEIYFGKKIPLFHLERMSKNRIRFNLIKKLRNFEALSKLTNWHSSYLKENNIGLTNYLSDYLGNLDNKIVKISNRPRNIIYYLMPEIKRAIQYKVYGLSPKEEKKDSPLVSDAVIKSFPAKIMALGNRNKVIARDYNNMKQKNIHFNFYLEERNYKKYGKNSSSELINRFVKSP